MVYLSSEIYFFHFLLEHFQEDCDATFTWSGKETSAKKELRSCNKINYRSENYPTQKHCQDCF